MADNTAISNDSIQTTDEKPKNPFVSFMCSVLQIFKQPNNNKIEPTVEAASVTKPSTEEDKKTADVVKFPKQELPSLKLESDGAEPNTNPILLWQVYAIGGFFILKWAWTRWNERRGKGGPSNEEPPPSED